jgi:GAF domain-containing protein
MDESRTSSPGRGIGHPNRFRGLLHRLLQFANQGLTRMEFLRLTCGFLMEFSLADAAEIRLEESGKCCFCKAAQSGGVSRIDSAVPAPVHRGAAGTTDTPMDRIVGDILHGLFSAASPFSTRSGSFWTGDSTRPVLLWDKEGAISTPKSVVIGGEYPSLALLPIPVDEETRGVLLLGSHKQDFFTKEDILFLEAVAEALGVAIAFQSAQWALRERVKELTCLYGIAQVGRQPNIPLEDSLREIAALLPPGWQYPDITSARILLDDRVFTTPDFDLARDVQRAEIVINGQPRGSVEVAYNQEMPAFDEGPFLKEERTLLNEVARQVGFLIDHRADEEETLRLRERLSVSDAHSP